MESSRSNDQHDRELVARFRRGDADAFGDIIAAHQQRITRLVHRLLGWSGDVEDVVQDVFLCALQHLHRFREEARLSTWLTTIAVNTCRSCQRRRVLRLRNLSRVWRGTQNGKPPADSDEMHEEVRESVRRLPAKYRVPIVLRYFENLSVPEIGEALGLSLNAVEVRLSRARRHLKESLARQLGKE